MIALRGGVDCDAVSRRRLTELQYVSCNGDGGSSPLLALLADGAIRQKTKEHGFGNLSGIDKTGVGSKGTALYSPTMPQKQR